MTQVKHFPTYDIHNTHRTLTIGPNTYASVARRLQDGEKNVSRAYHLSRNLRWVAQELAGGAQSFKDFDLNLFIVNLVKNPDEARAWQATMSAFLAKEGCATVGFEKSMWTVMIEGARILLEAHIDFVITCANQL